MHNVPGHLLGTGSWYQGLPNALGSPFFVISFALYHTSTDSSTMLLHFLITALSFAKILLYDK